jgi:hypothetical protein
VGRYDTNLAAEFYVLSMLHRLGMEANLTLGNKKGVDIVLVRDPGEAVTIDVKGVAKRYDWPAGNIYSAHPERHFVVLVSFEGRISDPTAIPRCWVVPLPYLEPFFRQYSGRRNVSRSMMLSEGQRFEEAWSLLDG